MGKLFKIFLFLSVSGILSAQVSLPETGQDFPLDPAKAFDFRWEKSGEEVILIWNIQKNYYLYQSKFSITPGSGVSVLKQEISEPSSIHEDIYFGKQPIHEKSAFVKLTLKEKPEATDAQKTLQVVYQGCWKKGVCYPPQRKTVLLSSFQ